jgi:LPS sulfotransferase NodH
MIKFVVLGMPRTGSTLLLTGLQQHPDIKAYGELMHAVDAERSRGHHVIQRKEVALYFSGDGDAVTFLKQQVFDYPHPCAKAVGFKLHSEFKQCAGTLDLLPRLAAEIDGLHVIHLVRENYFDVFVSRKVAETSGLWRQPTGSAPVLPPKIRIDPDTAVSEIERYAQADRILAETFNSGKYLRILYTDLAASFSAEMKSLFEFLGVDPVDVNPLLEKQIKQRPADFIENFEELLAVPELAGWI